MYLLQIIALVIYVIVMIAAIYDFRKTVIAWVPLSLLFNPQVCILYFPQALALTLAVNASLIGVFFTIKRGVVKYAGNNEPFTIRAFMVFMIMSYIISMMFSVIPFASSVNKLIKTVFINYGMIYVYFRCLNTKEDIKLLVKISLLVAILITLDGIVEWVTHVNIAGDFIFLTSPHFEELGDRSYYIPYFVSEHFRSRYDMTRSYSFFALHIHFGTACAMLFFLIMQFFKNKWCIYKSETIIYKIFIMIVLLLLLFGVVCSNSKTPMLGLGVLMFALFRFKDVFNIKFLIALVLCMVLLSVYAPNYVNNLFSLTDEELADEGGGSTIAVRKMQLNTVMHIFYQSPLIGTGIGAVNCFSKNIVEYGELLGAESQWFQLFVDQGILGCIAYIYMYFVMINFCKGIVPSKTYKFFLASVLVMETTTGGINLLLWLPILIAIRRYYLLQKCKYKIVQTTR